MNNNSNFVVEIFIWFLNKDSKLFDLMLHLQKENGYDGSENYEISKSKKFVHLLESIEVWTVYSINIRSAFAEYF